MFPIVLMIVIGVMYNGISTAMASNTSFQGCVNTNSTNSCGLPSTFTILNPSSPYTYAVSGDVAGFVSSLFSPYHQTPITSNGFGATSCGTFGICTSENNPTGGLNFSQCQYGVIVASQNGFTCLAAQIPSALSQYFTLLPNCNNFDSSGNCISVPYYSLICTVPDITVQFNSAPCTIDGVATQVPNNPYSGDNLLTLSCADNNPAISGPYAATLACPLVVEGIGPQNVNVQTQSPFNGCGPTNIAPCLSGTFTTIIKLISTQLLGVLGLVAGIILVISSLGIGVKLGASGVENSNPQGSKLTQSLGIGLILWSLATSEFSGWISAIGGGFGNGAAGGITSGVIYLVLSLVFFIGIYLNLD